MPFLLPDEIGTKQDDGFLLPDEVAAPGGFVSKVVSKARAKVQPTPIDTTVGQEIDYSRPAPSSFEPKRQLTIEDMDRVAAASPAIEDVNLTRTPDGSFERDLRIPRTFEETAEAIEPYKLPERGPELPPIQDNVAQFKGVGGAVGEIKKAFDVEESILGEAVFGQSPANESEADWFNRLKGAAKKRKSFREWIEERNPNKLDVGPAEPPISPAFEGAKKFTNEVVEHGMWFLKPSSWVQMVALEAGTDKLLAMAAKNPALNSLLQKDIFAMFKSKKVVNFKKAAAEVTDDMWEAAITLDIKPTAPLQNIKTAYRKKSFQTHPDHGGSKSAFQAVENAFDVLFKRRNGEKILLDLQRMAPGQKVLRGPELSRQAGSIFIPSKKELALAVDGVVESPTLRALAKTIGRTVGVQEASQMILDAAETGLLKVAGVNMPTSGVPQVDEVIAEVAKIPGVDIETLKNTLDRDIIGNMTPIKGTEPNAEAIESALNKLENVKTAIENKDVDKFGIYNVFEVEPTVTYDAPPLVRKWLEKGTTTITERQAPIKITEPEMKIKDLSGNMVSLPKGHEFTPYKLSNGKVWLHDGKNVVIESGQLQNLKNKNLVLSGKKIMPGEEGIEEIVKVQAGKAPRGTPLPEMNFVKGEDGGWTSPLGWEIVQFSTGNYGIVTPFGTELSPGDHWTSLTSAKHRAAIESVGIGKTKFEKYQLPGGENYQEILFQAPLPKAPDQAVIKWVERVPGEWKAIVNGREFGIIAEDDHFYVYEKDKNLGKPVKTVEEGKMVVKDTLSVPAKPGVHSPHWNESNIVAHARVNDRTTADGKKILFIEEIQSDWAGKGRKQGFGYDVPRLRKKLVEDRFYTQKEIDTLSDEQVIEAVQTEESYENLIGEAVPFQPLLKKWVEFTLKRIVDKAVAGGYDGIGWISGQQTADRYDLSKKVEDITWGTFAGTGKKLVQLKPKTGSLIRFSVEKDGLVSPDATSSFKPPEQFIGKKLTDVIGKGLAEKILESDKGELTGTDLKIGGEWAKKLYDQKIPSILKKMTKGKVEKVTYNEVQEGDIMNGIEREEGQITQQAIMLTPDVKAQVLASPAAGGKNPIPKPQKKVAVAEKIGKLTEKEQKRALLLTKQMLLKGAEEIYAESAKLGKDILKEGGISTYKDEFLAEEFKAIPVRFRRKAGWPLDVMKDKLNAKGYTFETDDQLRFAVEALGQSGKPKMSDFTAQAEQLMAKEGADVDSIKRSILKLVKVQDVFRTEERGFKLGVKVGKRALALRRAALRSIQVRHDLPDTEFKKLLRRDPGIMDDTEFKNYRKQVEAKAVVAAEKVQAMNSLRYHIEEKKLDIDNLRKAMKLPTLANMTKDEIQLLDKALEPYEEGDVFMGVRKIQTAPRTELGEVKTWREVREKFSELYDVPLESLMDITATNFDRMRFDTALTKRHAFFKIMVESTSSRMMAKQNEYLLMEKDFLHLVKKLKVKGVTGRLIPQQKTLRRYLEAPLEDKAAIAREMSLDEIAVADFITQELKKARDYLIQIEAMQTGLENYFVHIRRGFLEMAKETKLNKAGIMAMAEELTLVQKMEEQSFQILDRQTSEILALDKFFKFALHRTGSLVPTENVVQAFLTYMKIFKTKQALDEVTPLIDIYANALTPRGETKTGIAIHSKLVNFVKEYMNTKKGRQVTLGISQGSKEARALNAANMFVTLLDLGANLAVSVASEIGEVVSTYQLLGKRKYLLGAARHLTRQGMKIINENRAFVGKNPWTELFEPAKNIGDRFMEGLFILFRDASTRENGTFLLGSMTQKEFKTGVISDKRLAELRTEMGRYRVVEGSKSVYGATPIGRSWTKYKTWAIPHIRTQMENLKNLSVKLLSKNVSAADKKRSAVEVYRAVELTAFVLAMAAYIGLDDDDNSFLGRLKKKMYREAMTQVQALNIVSFATAGRLSSFITKFLGNLASIVELEEYEADSLKDAVTSLPGRVKLGRYEQSGYWGEKGELKAPKKIKRQLTPVAISQFQTRKKKKTGPPLVHGKKGAKPGEEPLIHGTKRKKKIKGFKLPDEL